MAENEKRDKVLHLRHSERDPNTGAYTLAI
jgi:hypothetical protein